MRPSVSDKALCESDAALKQGGPTAQQAELHHVPRQPTDMRAERCVTR